jgi:hypothetical protein
MNEQGDLQIDMERLGPEPETIEDYREARSNTLCYKSI